jgi:hypothetical protein
MARTKKPKLERKRTPGPQAERGDRLPEDVTRPPVARQKRTRLTSEAVDHQPRAAKVSADVPSHRTKTAATRGTRSRTIR